MRFRAIGIIQRQVICECCKECLFYACPRIILHSSERVQNDVGGMQWRHSNNTNFYKQIVKFTLIIIFLLGYLASDLIAMIGYIHIHWVQTQ